MDGLISAALGAYFFLVGSGIIASKPADTPEKRETQERVRPIMKFGGGLVFLFGVARIAGVIR